VVLSRRQTLEVCRLVTDWSGQGPIDLPGVVVRREGDRLLLSAAVPPQPGSPSILGDPDERGPAPS
jgi:tRNA(Ile)-lysidine synthase